nr:ThiF family adenylyltransferase [Ferrimicrobium acidiphilum]
MTVTLTMTESHHDALMQHLFPEDGCEAVAVALCGRAAGNDFHRLLIHRLELVPYSVCSVRRPDCVTWPTDLLVSLLAKAKKHDWALVKIHGHRHYDRFSAVDDGSDRQLFPSIYSWTDSAAPHASAIVMDDGRVFGRVVHEDGTFADLASVSVVGDDIQLYHTHGDTRGTMSVPEFGRRVAQAFGTGTYQRLRDLRIAVVGCSGTGSPVIEQLARNCVGSLVLIDPDHVEEKNLNRIVNTTMEDARKGLPKVEVAARAIRNIGLGTEVKTYARTLFDRDVIREISLCDVVFGCMDTIDGRYLLNKIAAFYMIPYFDLGVKLEADGMGGVNQVCGSVHYLKPGGSSLMSRNVFSLEQVRAAGLQRTDPEQYKQLLSEGYIRGGNEDRPAVVQLNSLIASLAVCELLARLHPYRIDPNGDYAINRVSLSHGIFDHEADGAACPMFSRHVGRGDVEPPLDWAELSWEKTS